MWARKPWDSTTNEVGEREGRLQTSTPAPDDSQECRKNRKDCGSRRSSEEKSGFILQGKGGGEKGDTKKTAYSRRNNTDLNRRDGGQR